MIRVQEQPEPAYFEAEIRQPGLQAVRNGVDPLPALWRRCLSDLHELYGGICAYICIYIPRAVGARTVEHFAPKSKHPNDAYDWRNYRLTCSLMNSRKNAFEDVIDPFVVVNGWFHLEFSGLQVLPNPDLDTAIRKDIQDTIDRLQLNDSECTAARSDYYDEFIGNHIDLDFIQRRSPFMAREMQRQGLV